MSQSQSLSIELDMAISVARGFYLGDDPVDWSDNDIASAAETLSEASGVDRGDLELFLVAEREARKLRRH
jgi:hypothetical protein